MMRSFALIALLSFSAQAVTDMNDELADKLVEKLTNKFLQIDPSLDGTTLGKPGTMQKSSLTIPLRPAQAMPNAASMQAYSPINGKKYETLSYLPQLSNEQISKQIAFMIRNDWTPALEFSEDGDLYLNTRMGPGYYDNRYWSMYKLPMFGCHNPQEVIREIENCKKEFPNAKIRVIAYDSIKQVQTAGFIVRK